ncbi:MAG: LacI family DNA-binding transcriptional regulator [Lysobacterales bacterium]
MKKVGIRDIAAEAGVSIATVSHALRNPGRVSDVTRQKVLIAADKVGYTPNRLAASLRTDRSGNIVVIIPDVTDSFNSGIIGAIEKVAHQRGYSVLLGDTQGSPEREREFAAMTRSRQADGIILLSHRFPFEPIRNKAALRDLPPIVNGCEFTGQQGVPVVGIDDVQAAMDATLHLVGFGHRDIAVITGDMASRSSRDRLTGFERAMQSAGLKVKPQRVLQSEYNLQGGERGAQELLLQKSRPSAIFCFSDEIAFGCMYALRQSGLRVPTDISVIGFDDIRFARYFDPPLTTIAQPTEAIGATCASLLFDLIEGRAPPEMRHILPHELVVRASTRRLA